MNEYNFPLQTLTQSHAETLILLEGVSYSVDDISTCRED